MSDVTFEQAVRTFDEHRPEWSGHLGKYVLIHGSTVVNFYSAYDDAIQAGYEKFGIEPFLVRRIVDTIAEARLITRLHDPSSLASGA